MLTHKYNVIADNWTNGKYCLGANVNTYEEAERYVSYYTQTYEGKPYPNGKGYYPFKNFRVVLVITQERKP